MALTIYEGIKDNKLVDEDIDQVILRLLGLEDINDLDYDTYKTLLKEKMMAGRMRNSAIPSSETEKLTNEYKRVKRETGRFKVKKKPIKKDSFTPPDVSRGTRSSKRPASRPTKALVGSKVQPEKEIEVEGKGKPQDVMGFLTAVVAPRISRIETILANILSNISNQQKAEEKAAEKARTSSEKTKKRDKESKIELGSGLLGKAGDVAKKVTAPLSGIFDVILKFFTSILAGVATLKLLEFFKDPQKFFRDMINGVIDFFNDVIEIIFNIVVVPINEFINTLNESLRSFAESVNKAIDGLDFLGVIPDIQVPTFEPIELPQIPRISEPEPEPVPGMVGGGRVDSSTGTRISSMGADTQLVALQPGEVVMSNKAVNAYGADTLLGMNAAAGGTNIPKMGEVPGFNNGGRVGGHMPSLFGASGVQTSPSTPSPKGYNSNLMPSSSASGLLSKMGVESQDWKIYKDTLASIETSGMSLEKAYSTSGGSGGAYDGRYQMGGMAKEDAARILGIPVPSRSEFRSNPQLQEDMILAYTYANNNYMLSHNVPTYNSAGSRERLSYLGFAHNQGHSNAANWLLSNKTKDPTRDGFGTSGTKFTKSLNRSFGTGSTEIGKSSGVSVPPPPGSRTGSGSIIPVAIPGQQTPSSTSGPAQSKVPMFSSIDLNNPDLLVVKSIYNIVG